MSLGPILIGLPGAELTPECRTRLQHPAVGGVVLFARNFVDRHQLDELIAGIRSSRQERLLIAVDQEGGRVQRLRESFAALPPLAVLGELYRTDREQAADMAWRHGRVMATEVLACGIDLSFAPVLDLGCGSSVIGDRALSADPRIVSCLGAHYLAGMHDAGMKTCGKHFPGHGSVVADSHFTDVRDERPLETLRIGDMSPFISLHEKLDSLMIAHVVYPHVDSLPAGYSRRWLDDILRQEIGYRGIVISDDLGMHAAMVAGTVLQRVDLCLGAGCDLVLVCQDDDVDALMSELEGWKGRDATRAIERLYGESRFCPADLDALASNGVGEWAHWRDSLENLEQVHE